MNKGFLDLIELEELRGVPLENIDVSVCACSDVADSRLLARVPRVSVAVLAYNHGPYLKQTLEGALKQKTTFPFEIVVAEDCSTDHTREIALEYQRLYPELIRVLYSSANIGGTANSCRAFQHCRGEYIAYCEGDDFWHAPEKLQRQVEVLDAHLNVGLAFSGGRLAKGQLVEKLKGWCRADELLHQGVIPAEQGRLALFRSEWHPLTCSCVVRRQCIESGYRKNPFFMKRLTLGDTLKWLEILSEKDAFFSDEDWVTQVVHEGSATHGVGREYVSRDGNMILCYFSALTNDQVCVKEYQVGALKARLAIASASRDLGEIGRVIRYCWRKRMRVSWRLMAYMGLAAVGGVAWGKRMYLRQR